MSTSDWDTHRPTIERLYRQYDLKTVMEEMESQHAFKKGESAYRRHIREWGLQKNFSGHVWEQVIDTIGAREQGVTPGEEILVGGQAQSYQKLKRKLHQVSLPSLAQKHSIPTQCPENVSAQHTDLVTFCSPPLGPFRSTDAPWLDFTNIWKDSKTKDLPPGVSPLHVLQHLQNSPLSRMNLIANPDVLYDIFRRDPLKGTYSVVPDVDAVTAAISMVMPADNLEQHRVLAERICSPGFPGGSLTMLYVHLFLISNNFPYHMSLYMPGYIKMNYHEQVTRTLRTMPFFNKESLRSLLSTSDASFRAILEELCGSVLRTFDPEALRICLGAGLWPGEKLRLDGKTWWLLELAAIHGQGENIPEITRLILLRRRNPVPTEGDLTRALSLNNVTMATELVRLGAKVDAAHFKSSLLCHDTDSVRFCLAHGVNVNDKILVEHESSEGLVDDFMAFTQNRANKLGVFKKFLVAQPMYQQHGKHFDFPAHSGQATLTALGLSIIKKHHGALPGILAGCKHINFTQELYFTGAGFLQTSALGLAVLLSSPTETVAKLLEAYANLNLLDEGLELPLILACLADNMEAVQLLLDAGADVSQAEKHHVLRDNNLSLLEILSDPDQKICENLITHGAVILPKTMTRAFLNRDKSLWPILEARGCDSLLRQSTGAEFEVAWVADIFEEGVAKGDRELVNLFLNEPILRPVTEICRITRIGSLKVGQDLREAGCLARIAEQTGVEVMCRAIYAREINVLRLMLRFDLDLARRVSGRTFFRNDPGADIPLSALEFARTSELLSALECATTSEQFMLADLLMDRGAPITARAFHDYVAWACKNSHLEVLPQFLRRLQHQDRICRAELGRYKRQGAICIALRQWNDAVLQQLLDAGIDPTGRPPRELDHVLWTTYHCQVDSPYWSSLACAAQASTADNVNRLLGAAPWNPKEKTVALTCAIDVGNLGMVESLLASGAVVNGDILPYHSTPLSYAIRQGNLEMLSMLIAQGGDIERLSDAKGSKTALQCAVECGDMEVTKFLIENGADINAPAGQNNGATALQIAGEKGYLAITTFLLDHGADPNAQGADVGGYTALEMAARFGRLDTVQLLLRRGVRTDGRHREACVGSVAYAYHNGFSVVAQVIRDASEWTELDEANVKIKMMAMDRESAKRDAFVTRPL